VSDIGELVSLALTIGLSPIPIAGVLLMLISPGGLRPGLGFALGWTAGVLFALSLVSVIASLLPPAEPGTEDPISRTVPLVLGIGLVLLGIRQLSTRPRRGAEVPLPRWMAAIDTLTPLRAALLGFAYAAFRPKNLIVTIAAGVIILRSSRDLGAIAVSIALFTAIAAVPLLAPVVVYALGTAGLRERIARLRGWIVASLPTITGTTFVLIGAALLAFGLLGSMG
jgi:hypothetical protein